MLNFLRLPRQNNGSEFLKEFRGSCGVKTLFIFCIAAATLAAQDSDSSGTTPSITQRITAASQFFDHDFVNVYGFGNGIWDSRVASGLNSSGQEVYGGGFGWEAGGGITASHTFRDASFTINYRGAYRDYQSSSIGSGQQQTLSLGYNKRLNRHWSLNIDAQAGILAAGTSFYSASSITSTTPGNPYSLESRFANAGLSLTYMQTRRLSYVFSGNFLYNGYKRPDNLNGNPFASPLSTRGVTGSASVLYRLTARDTIGASYARSYYKYSGQAGTTNVDSASLTYSHLFSGHWQLDLSGGINRSNSSGIALTPVVINILGIPVEAICECPYNRSVLSPAYQGVLTHFFHSSSFSVSGGQSILAGNGLYLASRDQFVNGSYSYSTRRSNLGFGGNYSRLSSVSTAALGQTYAYYGASAFYGINLVRYISANLRYDLLHYNNIFHLANGDNGYTENRVSFGISVSSRSVPLTLF